MILARIYGGVVAARNSMYDHGIFKPRHLNWPVVSVGNISAGGSGKTPFVIALRELLLGRGIDISVLSRGYRRSSSGVLSVDPSGTPEKFGDEPLLIARKLRCAVTAGTYAEHQYIGASQCPMHLLDDGFQHRQLHRDFDIVLLNREDLDDELLPRGHLREPPASLRRADAVVIDGAVPLDWLPKGAFQVWRIEREITIPELNVPVIAFCGIARPQRFFTALRSAGLDVREEVTFRDHHRYTAADVNRLAASRARLHGSALVTTEKDAINLSAQFDTLKPVVVPMHIRFADPENAVKYLLGTLTERCARAGLH